MDLLLGSVGDLVAAIQTRGHDASAGGFEIKINALPKLAVRSL